MRAALSIALVASLLGVAPAAAQSPAGSYTPCEPVGAASVVEVTGATCDEARAVAASLVAAPAQDARGILGAAGWQPVRARSSADRRAHDIVAIRPGGALRVRRPGEAPDLDGWSSGRELIFARRRLIGGRPVPKDAVLCTSAFLVRMSTGRLGGLTAAHCGGTRRDGTTERHNAALRRPPEPGIVLGRVQRNVERRRPLDALLVPIPSGPNRTASAVIDRGIDKPPWRIAGTARPLSKRGICFAGRTSGADRCGRIAGRNGRPAERLLGLFSGLVVRCTTISAREGDSGGPVYTPPSADGTVRAVGITTLVFGDRSLMCFTPLIPVLDEIRAEVVIAPGAAAPAAVPATSR